MKKMILVIALIELYAFSMQTPQQSIAMPQNQQPNTSSFQQRFLIALKTACMILLNQ